MMHPTMSGPKFGLCEELQMQRRPHFSTGTVYNPPLKDDIREVVETFATQELAHQERKSMVDRYAKQMLDGMEYLPDEEVKTFMRQLRTLVQKQITIFQVDGKFYKASNTQRHEDAAVIQAIREKAIRKYGNQPEKREAFLSDQFKAFVTKRLLEGGIQERPLYYMVTPEGRVEV